jgi:hypothetical protein
MNIEYSTPLTRFCIRKENTENTPEGIFFGADFGIADWCLELLDKNFPPCFNGVWSDYYQFHYVSILQLTSKCLA